MGIRIIVSCDAKHCRNEILSSAVDSRENAETDAEMRGWEITASGWIFCPTCSADRVDARKGEDAR